MRIKNWEKFQHYQSGRGAPPWIKLYRDLLNDKEWHLLNSESAKVLISCWILAAEDGGSLPDIDTIAFRLRLDSKVLAKHLKNCSHWIIFNENKDASKVLADCKQLATPETETETETEAVSKKHSRKKKTTIPEGFIVSESVKAWAEEKGYSKLDERLTHFVTSCQAKGYEYADWDAAFRNAISGDWAKLGGAISSSNKPFDLNDWMKNK